ncbi:MAG: NifU family protein [Nannocystaceae bacterium]
MIGTLAQRFTVLLLDAAVARGQRSRFGGVRAAAQVLDRARGIVGLDAVRREVPLPDWAAGQPERPMWESDRKKLHKWQRERGIGGADEQAAAPAKATPTVGIEIYYKRGCPYARAAIELLRERELPFVEHDVKGDVQRLEWLAIVTGKKTTPQVFVQGQPIGGYDELRALDQSGELARRLGVVTGSHDGEAVVVVDDEVAVEDVRARIDEGAAVLVLDVRTHAEADDTGMLPHAVLMPLDELEARAAELDRDGVWVVVCRSGVRSRQAVAAMRGLGFRQAVSLQGGIEAWRAAGGSLVRLGATAPRTAAPRRLPVVHPERSPFEAIESAANAIAAGERLEGDELVARVREVLAECRPLIVADGGDIELLDVQGDVVHVALSGNCIGCPSSQATLRQGIERRLKQRIPQLVGIASPQLR